MSSDVIDVSGFEPAEVLAALYNASQPLGLGFLHYTPAEMTIEDARTLLDGSDGYFDYLKGRVMKVLIDGKTLDPRLYDRDNGAGSAARALKRFIRREAHLENCTGKKQKQSTHGGAA